MYLTHKNSKGNLLFFALAKDIGHLVITYVFNTQELHSSCLAFLIHINTYNNFTLFQYFGQRPLSRKNMHFSINYIVSVPLKMVEQRLCS